MVRMVMYVGKKNGWHRYSVAGDWNLSKIKDCGKWMHFFNDSQFAVEMINKALELGITNYAKHTGGSTGVVCFYASGSDYANHLKVLDFFLKHNLVRLTPSYKYTDISFKFNGQSWSKEYGPNFEGMIKLSDFISLETGQAKPEFDMTKQLTVDQFPIGRGLISDNSLSPLIEQINYFATRKINTIFRHNPDSIDFNDKIMHLAPFNYKVTSLFNLSNQDFMRMVALLINWILTTKPTSQLSKIERVLSVDNPEFNNLIKLFDDEHLSSESLSTKFTVTYSHNIFDHVGYASLGYLIYLSLLVIDCEEFDLMIKNK